MITVRVCPKLKTAENWLFLQIKSGRILEILWAFLIEQLFALVGYEMTSALRAWRGYLPSSTSTSTSTLFHKTIGYNRLARKIAIANLGGPVKRKIN